MQYIRYRELDPAQQQALLQRPGTAEQQHLETQVAAIEQQVFQRGDAALEDYSRRFDAPLQRGQFAVAPPHWAAAWRSLDAELQGALSTALENIAAFHRSQLPRRSQPKLQTSPGVHCWREFRAVESVGLYVPGGSAPLFSTMLMLGVPAILAGCAQIVFCSPPHAKQTPNEQSGQERASPATSGVYAAPEMLACMYLLQQFAQQLAQQMTQQMAQQTAKQTPPSLQYFQVGGAQAIFALAAGAAQSQAELSLPPVDKIFGPGNPYVTAAKLRASRYVAIDMPAGPSEVLIVAEAGQNPAALAADLLAQAEHGPGSQVLLLSFSRKLLRAVEGEVQRQAAGLPRANQVRGVLQNSYLIETSDLAEALAFSNAYAPEHLILAINDYQPYLSQVVNAGSVFCGPQASVSFGDYASGTNHTLPTAGFARSMGGLGTQDFGRWLSFQSVSDRGLQELGPLVVRLAGCEQLQAHQQAVTVRLNRRP